MAGDRSIHDLATVLLRFAAPIQASLSVRTRASVVLNVLTAVRQRTSPLKLFAFGFLLVLGCLSQARVVDSVTPSSDEIIARVETENGRRHSLLKEYSIALQYTLQNARFGKQAAVGVLMRYRQVEGERYTVLTRSGSGSLNSVIDKVLASETGASIPPESAHHQINGANYRVRFLGTEVAAGRSCYVLELTPRIRSRFLIIGKAWVDEESYGLVRLEGQFAASTSLLIGAPTISEQFIEVQGFWLPAHIRSVSSSLLLGPSEMNILYSNYRLKGDPQSPIAAQAAGVSFPDRLLAAASQ